MLSNQFFINYKLIRLFISEFIYLFIEVVHKYTHRERTKKIKCHLFQDLLTTQPSMLKLLARL